MEEKIENFKTLIIEKEIALNTTNFYFFLTLLEFVYYINNFPILPNEDINRLKFFFYRLFQTFENNGFKKLEIRTGDEKIISNITAKLFLVDVEKNDDFLRNSLISILLVFNIYEIIGNLISKKNIFTKKVETKIEKIVELLVKNFYKNIYDIRILTLQGLYEVIEKSINIKQVNLLKERQEQRFNCRNFVEYQKQKNDKSYSFNYIQNIDSLITLYKSINNIEYEDDYTKQFINELPSFLEELTK